MPGATAMTQVPAKERLALALDLPLRDAEKLYEKVSECVGYVKVGLSLFVERGPETVLAFTRRGARVFLDLKLHDIPNTVQLAAEGAAELGVSLLTVHAQGGPSMLRAAAEGARRGAERKGIEPPKLLAVTVLTSLNSSELTSLGYAEPPEALVLRLAGLAKTCGIQGLVCSAREIPGIRKAFGPQLFLCTPGIRQTGAASQDQFRVETPAAAIHAGADLLVVGRPIYEAPDPVVAARSICAEIASALATVGP